MALHILYYDEKNTEQKFCIFLNFFLYDFTVLLYLIQSSISNRKMYEILR